MSNLPRFFGGRDWASFRQMADEVDSLDGFRTRTRVVGDTVLTMRTKGGMPIVTSETRKTEAAVITPSLLTIIESDYLSRVWQQMYNLTGLVSRLVRYVRKFTTVSHGEITLPNPETMLQVTDTAQNWRQRHQYSTDGIFCAPIQYPRSASSSQGRVFAFSQPWGTQLQSPTIAQLEADHAGFLSRKFFPQVLYKQNSSGALSWVVNPIKTVTTTTLSVAFKNVPTQVNSSQSRNPIGPFDHIEMFGLGLHGSMWFDGVFTSESGQQYQGEYPVTNETGGEDAHLFVKFDNTPAVPELPTLVTDNGLSFKNYAILPGASRHLNPLKESYVLDKWCWLYKADDGYVWMVSFKNPKADGTFDDKGEGAALTLHVVASRLDTPDEYVSLGTCPAFGGGLVRGLVDVSPNGKEAVTRLSVYNNPDSYAPGIAYLTARYARVALSGGSISEPPVADISLLAYPPKGSTSSYEKLVRLYYREDPVTPGTWSLAEIWQGQSQSSGGTGLSAYDTLNRWYVHDGVTHQIGTVTNFNSYGAYSFWDGTNGTVQFFSGGSRVVDPLDISPPDVYGSVINVYTNTYVGGSGLTGLYKVVGMAHKQETATAPRNNIGTGLRHIEHPVSGALIHTGFLY